MLYEMLTGGPAFAGETTTDVLSAVVRADPDWSALPLSTPAHVSGTIRRCLVKDARQRLRDIGDVRQELERPAEAPSAVVAAPGPSRGRRWVMAGLALVAILGVAAAAAMWLLAGRSSAIEWSTATVGGPQIAFFPRLSPDRKTLAFMTVIEGQSQVGILNPRTGDWSILTRDRHRGSVLHIAWSADGSRIYFDRSGGSLHGDIWSVPALGGEPRLMVENGTAPEPLPDGSLLMARANRDGRRQLHRYVPRDGTLAALPVLVLYSTVNSFRAFPDGDEAVVFGYAVNDRPTAPQLYVVGTESGAVRLLAPSLRNLDPESVAVPPLGVSADGRFVFTTRPALL